MFWKLLAATFLVPSIAFSASAGVEIIKDASEVTFLAVGKPSAIKIRGEKGKPEGSLSFSADGKTTGEIKLDLNDLATGISLRDRHMKEKYLETQKDGFRHAVIQISKVNFPSDFWTSQKTGEYPFSGSLALHGVKKDIQGTIKVNERKADSLKGNSSFSIKLTDYGIQIPSFSGITVAENVEVQVNFAAKTSSAK
jgi:polyisoprenoid-binding protein YceI